MKISEIYLKAAERIFEKKSSYACSAIKYISDFIPEHYKEPIGLFNDWFQPKFIPLGVCWWANRFKDGAEAFEADRLPRQLALLFMHEIALDLEKK